MSLQNLHTLKHTLSPLQRSHLRIRFTVAFARILIGVITRHCFRNGPTPQVAKIVPKTGFTPLFYEYFVSNKTIAFSYTSDYETTRLSGVTIIECYCG